MPMARIDLGLAAPVRLGRLMLHPALREIRRNDGAEQVIEPRVMQVLLALADAQGAIVRREELTERCWEGRIVGEDAINRVLSRLRRVAEGIGAESFRIETITKVGYRLVALAESGEGVFQPVVGGADPPRDHRSARSRILAYAGAAAVVLLIGIVGWWLLRPAAPAHSMTVRLSGYDSVAGHLPASVREAVGAEIMAAFNSDGVIGVSTAATPVRGTEPAYALGGTIYRVDGAVRVITRFINERTGTILWSDSVDYPAAQTAMIPRKIAVDAAIVIRCGLFGAASYHKRLSDAVLSNYLQYCQEYWAYGGSKTLRFAQRVVAAVPDFSWGWSAVGNGFMQASALEPDARRAAELRAAGRTAEDRAIALDPTNSEALGHKAYLIDANDWVAQEALFKRAIAAQPLDCGCEHYGYGLKLESVGRLGAAVEQFRAATDMLALWPDSRLALASALVAMDRNAEARPQIEAAIDLGKDPDFDKWIAVTEGTETHDYAAAIAALGATGLRISDDARAALLAGYRTLASGDATARTKAITALVALPENERIEVVAPLLASLGATHEALLAARTEPRLFWHRSMRGVLDDPGFLGVARELGLLTYWRTTATRPDICATASPPSFCRSITATS